MNRTSLISLAIVVMTAVMASEVNAQEKQLSVGPAIEFGGGGTSFGINGKIGVSPQFSVRPMILFGYKPSVTRGDIVKGSFTAKGSSTSSPVPDNKTQNDLLQNPIFQAQADNLISNVGTGIAYGLGVTYDFKSPDGKISGYVGPRVLFASASGSGTFINGGSYTTNTTETNIGLTAGADYAISSDITAGLSATYDFARSGTASATDNNGTSSAPLSGGNFKVGVNFGYNF
jgi:hypothetical protein